MANTDPNHWFLPADMMPRTPHFTSDNEVTPLIDGAAYMSHLFLRISAMKSGDYFHQTGWRVTPDQLLEPTMAGPPTFIQQVTALINSGVNVRAMLWYHFGSGPIVWTPGGAIAGLAYKHPGENMKFVSTINNLNRANGAAILDDRVPTNKIASHHQKTIILRSGESDAAKHDWAYVGGIDICLDRWDVPAHNSPPQRQKEFMDAWHDVQVAVRGPAVAQVWENFKQRWNDPTKPHGVPGVPGGSNPPAITDPPPAGLSIGSQHVQVLRTLACGGVYSFMPAGEQTVRLAYERAIDRAQHYIYIEEQYFWPCTLIEKLKQAADRGVKIILVLSHKYDIPGISIVHERMRANAINHIRGSSPTNVYVYHLQQAGLDKDIYVHAKLMIVDDCYVAVGTANIGRRSHTTDSELHLGVVDADTVPGLMKGAGVQVCRFAKELRLALWREHLGLPDSSSIDDPILGLDQWPDQATSNPAAPNRRHHAVCHRVQAPPVDQGALRRFIISLLKTGFVLPLAVPDLPLDLVPDAVWESLVPDPEALIRDYIMNVETVC
ncbi:MAG: phospholipase D-like domain-containing protein [Anaerolineae bacterium]